MELSSVFVYPFRTARFSSPVTSYLARSPPLPTTTPNSINNSPSTSATTIHSEPFKSRPRNVYYRSQRPISVSHKARQSAILDLQNSKDLASALSRFFFFTFFESFAFFVIFRWMCCCLVRVLLCEIETNLDGFYWDFYWTVGSELKSSSQVV